MLRRLLVAVAVLLALAPATVALAQEAEELVIVDVNLSRYNEDGRVTIVAEFRNVDSFDPANIVVVEEGVVINDVEFSTIESSTVDVGVVLAIDVSGSMNTNDAIGAAKAAATQFVNQKREQDNIALVTFGNEVELLVPFTKNARAVTTAIEDIEAEGDTALFDAVVSSVDLYARNDLQPHIIILTDGADEGSAATLDDATAAVTAGQVRVFAVGLETTAFDPAALQAIADASPGGRYLVTTDPEQLDQLYNEIRRELNNKIVLQFNALQSQAAPTSFRVEYENLRAAQTVDVPGYVDRTPDATTVGATTSLAQATPYVAESRTPASLGTLVLVGSVMVGAAVLAVALVLFGPRGDEQQEQLRNRMRQFERGVSPDQADRSLLSRIPVLRRLSAQAEEVAQRRGIFNSINSVLEQANVPLRPGEAIALALVVALVAGAVVGAVTRNLIGGAFVAIAAVFAVFALMNVVGGREKRRFEDQLPDTLTLLSTSLRAGYSLLQAVEAVAAEAPEPTAREFGRAIAEIRLGRQVVDALQGVADRTTSNDFQWTVMAIEIQREVGGNLSEVLQTVADTMLQRNRLRREVRALTAEGRISGFVLGAMPFMLFLFLFSTNRDYLEPLFTRTPGILAMIIGIILIGIGAFWMKKIVDIEL